MGENLDFGLAYKHIHTYMYDVRTQYNVDPGHPPPTYRILLNTKICLFFFKNNFRQRQGDGPLWLPIDRLIKASPYSHLFQGNNLMHKY